jgi:hypothetical protein
MILDAHRGDFMEILLSSYGLSLFSSKAGSRHDDGAGAVPRGSPSISIGELWPGIDQLDDIGPEGTSVIVAPSPRRGSGPGGLAKVPCMPGRGLLVLQVHRHQLRLEVMVGVPREIGLCGF